MLYFTTAITGDFHRDIKVALDACGKPPVFVSSVLGVPAEHLTLYYSHGTEGQ